MAEGWKVIDMIGYIKNKCLMAGCCAVMMSVLTSAQSVKADESAADKKAAGKKVCLIIRPSVKAAADTSPASPSALDSLALSSRKSTGSFFSGQVEKLGFGTPDCFYVNGRQTADQVTHQLPPSLNSAPASDTPSSGPDDRSFYPSVGYFNRFSSEGRQALAIGVGFKGASPDELGDSPGLPEARVSLMVGFGF